MPRPEVHQARSPAWGRSREAVTRTSFLGCWVGCAIEASFPCSLLGLWFLRPVGFRCGFETPKP